MKCARPLGLAQFRERRDRRNRILSAIIRPAIYLGAIACLVALAARAYAETYQCMDKAGCVATFNKNGRVIKVQFRKGDVMTTNGGMHPDTSGQNNGGWVRLRSIGGDEGGNDPQLAPIDICLVGLGGDEHIPVGWTVMHCDGPAPCFVFAWEPGCGFWVAPGTWIDPTLGYTPLLGFGDWRFYWGLY